MVADTPALALGVATVMPVTALAIKPFKGVLVRSSPSAILAVPCVTTLELNVRS